MPELKIRNVILKIGDETMMLMSNSRWRPVPIVALRGDVQLTHGEREGLLEAASRDDDAKVRRILIGAAVRLERGEALLASLGWQS